jgi:hypothetical protein
MSFLVHFEHIEDKRTDINKEYDLFVGYGVSHHGSGSGGGQRMESRKNIW